VVDLSLLATVTSPALHRDRTRKFADVRRTVPAVPTVEGTGLPVGGFAVRIAGNRVVLAARDQAQVQQAMAGYVPAGTDWGIPPRRGLVRC
jgi:hypothetical protein